jgi:hypothetical protein
MESYIIRLFNTRKALSGKYEFEFEARDYKCGIIEITRQSPMRHRRYVEKMARYFMRELDLDHVQFCAREYEASEEDPYSAWLFVAESSNVLPPGTRIFGACCFRRRDFTDCQSPWSLEWVWLHPYFRNHGCLTQVWPIFRNRFGGFEVEGPYSKAMAAFLKKMGQA